MKTLLTLIREIQEEATFAFLRDDVGDQLALSWEDNVRIAMRDQRCTCHRNPEETIFNVQVYRRGNEIFLRETGRKLYTIVYPVINV